MNPTRLLTLPAHAAAAVLGTSVGLATAGVRTTARIAGRVIEQVSGSGPAPVRPWPGERTTSPVVPAPSTPTTAAGRAATDVPAEKAAPARKTAPAKKTARKAPSKQAAVLAPALGLSEDEVEAVTGDGPEPPSPAADTDQG